MDTKKAKQLSKIEKELIRKFNEAKKEESRRIEQVERENKGEIKPEGPKLLLGSVATPNLSVKDAKRIENIEKQLTNEFATYQRREGENQRRREKQYEPITKVLKDVKLQETTKEIVPFNPMVMSTPASIGVGGRKIHWADEEEEEPAVSGESFNEESTSSTLPSPSTPEKESFRTNKSFKQLVDSKVITLGRIGVRYIQRAKDDKFGIYFDEDDEKIKIGDQPITFDENDIIFIRSKMRYPGTEGLWRLLTKNDYFGKENMYTDDDWDNYKEILITSNAMFQRNDPKSGRPKASQGRKWKGMIQKIWKEYTQKSGIIEEEPSGSGIVEYNDNPIEYKYINSLSEVVKRLSYIDAQESAGNNNFNNEKLSLVKFLSDRLEELMKEPNGVKYLLRCLSALPERVMKGSGLINDLINKLPFELHVPGYNYCGPGTKLDKRLMRGDKGINGVDEACKKHDIWYRDHPKTEDRWEADKELEDTALGRVLSPDADMNERLVGLATGSTMWLKRNLGMGLSSYSCY